MPGCFVPGHVRIRENQLQLTQPKDGHRIKYVKVDADTGEEVASEDIGKGYKIDADTYVEVSEEELENVALESTAQSTYATPNRLDYRSSLRTAQTIIEKYLARTSKLAASAIAKFENVLDTDFAKQSAKRPIQTVAK